jgi:hypothetical protein
LGNNLDEERLLKTEKGAVAGVVQTESKEDEAPYYNVYGQRYHPYGNPYDYQYQNNIQAAVRSNEGAKGN